MRIDEAELARLDALPDSTYLKTSEAAALMRRNTKTLERWRKDGLPPPYRPNIPTQSGRDWSTSPIGYKKAHISQWNRDPSQPMHVYAFDGRCITSPIASLDDDQCAVGTLYDLLTQFKWASTSLMVDAEHLYKQEQKEREVDIQASIAADEKRRLLEGM